MKYLIDSNVIIDALTERDNDYHASREVIRQIMLKKIHALITAKQITDIYYSLKKYIPNEEKRRETINLIMDSFDVLPTLKSDLKYCIKSTISDYEDAVLDEVAKTNCINYIITNNNKDFKNAKTAILRPEEFLKLLQSEL